MSNWSPDKNSLHVVGFEKVELKVVSCLLDLLLVASRSSMRLAIKSNPASTLLAVSFTSFASAMLSAAASLVSVKVSARESNSDTETVVDSKDVDVDVEEASVGDTDGEELLIPGELVVSEIVDPELSMVDPVDPSVVMVVEDTRLVPTVDEDPSVLGVDPNESVDPPDPDEDPEVVVTVVVSVDPDEDPRVLVDAEVVVFSVVSVNPNEDPPVLVDPEVVIVSVVSVDPNEDPPVEPVEMVDPEVVDTLLVPSVEMVPAVEEGSEDAEEEASVDETTVVTTSGSIWQA